MTFWGTAFIFCGPGSEEVVCWHALSQTVRQVRHSIPRTPVVVYESLDVRSNVITSPREFVFASFDMEDEVVSRGGEYICIATDSFFPTQLTIASLSECDMSSWKKIHRS